MLAYLVLFAALFNDVCLYNAYLFFAIDFWNCFFSEFAPVAVETSGIFGSARCSLLTDIDRRILSATNDLRQMSYIFKKILVAIIRGNALAMTSSIRTQLC